MAGGMVCGRTGHEPGRDGEPARAALGVAGALESMQRRGLGSPGTIYYVLIKHDYAAHYSGDALPRPRGPRGVVRGWTGHE